MQRVSNGEMLKTWLPVVVTVVTALVSGVVSIGSIMAKFDVMAVKLSAVEKVADDIRSMKQQQVVQEQALATMKAEIVAMQKDISRIEQAQSYRKGR